LYLFLFLLEIGDIKNIGDSSIVHISLSGWVLGIICIFYILKFGILCFLFPFNIGDFCVFTETGDFVFSLSYWELGIFVFSLELVILCFLFPIWNWGFMYFSLPEMGGYSGWDGLLNKCVSFSSAPGFFSASDFVSASSIVVAAGG
jgi:hypothetical protein